MKEIHAFRHYNAQVASRARVAPDGIEPDQFPPGKRGYHAAAPLRHFRSGGSVNLAINTYRDDWLKAVIADRAVSGRTWLVASAMACAMGVGRVAPTDWQRLNAALRRDRMDPAVLASIAELQSAGYLERYLGKGWAHTAGWRLTLPGEEL